MDENNFNNVESNINSGNRNNKIMKVTIVILIVLVIALVLYLLYDKGVILNKDTDSNTSSSSNKSSENKNDRDVTDDTQNHSDNSKNEKTLKYGYYVFTLTEQEHKPEGLEFIIKLDNDNTFKVLFNDTDSTGYSGYYKVEDNKLILNSTKETYNSGDVYSSSDVFTYNINDNGEITGNRGNINITYKYTESDKIKNEIDNYFKQTTVKNINTLSAGYYYIEIPEEEHKPEGYIQILNIKSDKTFRLLIRDVDESKFAGTYDIKDNYLILQMNKEIQMDDSIDTISKVKKYFITSNSEIEDTENNKKILNLTNSSEIKYTSDNAFKKFNL